MDGGSKKRQCRVVFEYLPQNEDELELKVGDVVDINEEVEEGWWSGTMNGKSGLFPSNFVKEIEVSDDGEQNDVLDDSETNSKELPGAGPTTPTSPLLSPGVGNGAIAQPKKVRGVGFGDIFKEGSVKLKARLSSSESEERKLEKPLPSLPSAPKTNQLNMTDLIELEGESKPKVNEYCKALFVYEATNEDELSLKEGEIIQILSKDTGEPGWWRGEVNGREGVFPDNFVTVVLDSEKDVAAPKASFRSPPKSEIDDKPKKPTLPAKSPAPKPEVPSADRKPPPAKPEEKEDDYKCTGLCKPNKDVHIEKVLKVEEEEQVKPKLLEFKKPSFQTPPTQSTSKPIAVHIPAHDLKPKAEGEAGSKSEIEELRAQINQILHDVELLKTEQNLPTAASTLVSPWCMLRTDQVCDHTVRVDSYLYMNMELTDNGTSSHNNYIPHYLLKDDPFASRLSRGADVAAAVYVIIIGILSAVGNGYVIVMSWKRKTKLKPPELMTMNLAVFDLGISAIIVFSYAQIIKKVKASAQEVAHFDTRNQNSHALEMKLTKVAMLICAGFLIAWIPYAVVSVWSAFGQPDSVPIPVSVVPTLLAKSAAMYNPVIYQVIDCKSACAKTSCFRAMKKRRMYKSRYCIFLIPFFFKLKSSLKTVGC
ncbi:UNVERIFIED_CONTAM: hypothetical protein FKN15_042308 [Acipenser sinensis]